MLLSLVGGGGTYPWPEGGVLAGEVDAGCRHHGGQEVQAVHLLQRALADIRGQEEDAAAEGER